MAQRDVVSHCDDLLSLRVQDHKSDPITRSNDTVNAWFGLPIPKEAVRAVLQQFSQFRVKQDRDNHDPTKEAIDGYRHGAHPAGTL